MLQRSELSVFLGHFRTKCFCILWSAGLSCFGKFYIISFDFMRTMWGYFHVVNINRNDYWVRFFCVCRDYFPWIHVRIFCFYGILVCFATRFSGCYEIWLSHRQNNVFLINDWNSILQCLPCNFPQIQIFPVCRILVFCMKFGYHMKVQIFAGLLKD